MAASLQTFTVPTAALLPIGTSSPSGCCRSVKLPIFKGLKIQSDATYRNPRYLAWRTAGRKPRSIVCESTPQDTVVIVPGVTDGDWESNVLGSDTTVLVEFWAPWCGPCKMIHPVIDELAKQYAAKLKCFKVNTDESPVIATRYGIRSIPTVILFKSGEKKDTIIGAVPKSTFTTSIEKLL